MKKTPFGLLLILGVVIIFFYQFLFFGRLPIPSDTITGLYHPFRDYYSTDYPNGMPYKNFLITDPVRQQYPWRNLAIDNLKKIELPLWNPYNLTGTPLLANFQSGTLYPLNVFFFILPFSYAWSFLILLQPLLGGLFLFLYLRQKNIDKAASVLGGITFAFSGFSISWMEWGTVLQVAIWLPLILLAKEKLLLKMSPKWIFLLILAECCAILAGHLQILFYLWLVSTSYLLIRIIQLSWIKKSISLTARSVFLRSLPFLPIVIFILAVTAVQWLPTYQFINESAREIDQVNWQKEGWFIPFQHLIQFVIPDFFGNPTTLNYWGTWNYGELVGYVGIAPLILALFALFFRREKLVFYFGTVFFLSLFFSLPTFLAKLPFQLNIPFIATSQPTRLIFLTDFSLAILAALGADSMVRQKKGIIFPILFVGIIITTVWVLTLGSFEIPEKFSDNLTVVKSNLLFPTLIFLALSVLIITRLFWKNKIFQKYFLCFIILITILDLFRFGWKFLPFTSEEYLFPSTKVTEFLNSQKGQFRIMTTDSRIMPPNFSIMYKIETVDGYDPLYIRRYGELVAMMESEKGRVPGVLAFNRIITPHNFSSPLIDMLNVKYILSFDEIENPKFKKVFKEGKTIVYENTEVLKRSYFVKNIIPVLSKDHAASELFSRTFDPLNQAVVEEKEILEVRYSVGLANITYYSGNKVVINVENTGSGFLVLSDSFYPTWKAEILSSEGQLVDVKIYRTNYNFRGVVVPAGTKQVIFTNHLF